MGSEINLIALPHLDVSCRQSRTVAVGATVEEIVQLCLPGLVNSERKAVRVTIGDCEILPGLWHRVKPKPGMSVIVRVIPQGGGGLRSILAIVVTIAAIAVGQFYLAPALGFAAGGVGASIVTAATVSAAAFLFNALVPIKPPSGPLGRADDGQQHQAYSISGMRNALSPGGVVPNLLGTQRFAPPYATLPYTEISGDDQYVIAVFNFGYGPLEITNPRIGNNSVEVYAGVDYEVREGHEDDHPLSLSAVQVLEDSVDATAESTGDLVGEEIIRITARDVTEASIDLIFPQGLVEYDESTGDPEDLTVEVRVRMRELGDSGWTDVTTLTITAATSDVVRRTFRWEFPTRGQWEVGVTRLTANFNTVSQRGTMVWSALRGFRPEYPINFDQPLALAALRVRATGQLNGIIDDFNADVRRVCLDWDSEDEEWVLRATSNPASLYRYVLQSPANAFPKADAEIDLEALQDWHEHCVEQGLAYNRIHDFGGSLWDTLSAVAAAGRATPRFNGTKWGVVIDRPQEVIVGHLSPRNSWGFQGSRPYGRMPDAFRVTFLDETDQYRSVERVIPWPGFVGDPEVTEAIEFQGVTNPEQIFRETRRRQYERIYRPDRYTVNQDVEQLVLTRGDLCRVSHDVLDRTMIAGRVKAVTGGTVILDTLVTIETDVEYAIRFRLADGTSLLKAVENTIAEETDELDLNAGDMPAAGDLFFFGLAGEESLELIVQSIEMGDNLSSQLTLVDHAPQIETLANSDTLPDWATAVADGAVSAGRPSTPRFVALGTAAISANDIVPALPVGWQAGDIFLLVVETEEGNTVSAPAGWTAVSGSPQAAGGTRISLFWRRATSSEVAPTVIDSGGHQFGVISNYRGCVATGSPFDVTSAEDVAEVTDTWAVAGASTTVDDTLVVLLATNALNVTAANLFWSVTNPDLVGVSIRYCQNRLVSSFGGGIMIATGEMPSAGAFGGWTVLGVNTSPTLSNLGCITVALKKP